jgi:hypothetical protein
MKGEPPGGRQGATATTTMTTTTTTTTTMTTMTETTGETTAAMMGTMTMMTTDRTFPHRTGRAHVEATLGIRAILVMQTLCAVFFCRTSS